MKQSRISKVGLLWIAVAIMIFGIESVGYCEKRFRDAWQGEYNTFRPASLAVDSWKFYNLGYALSANAAMFEATRKTDYLDRALLYIENTISTAKPSRLLRIGVKLMLTKGNLFVFYTLM